MACANLAPADWTASQYRERVFELAKLVRGPVCADVGAVDAEGIYRDGKELARGADHVIVNVPMIEEGLQAARRLSADGHRVNLTLVFGAAQALFAAKAGATYVSVAAGELEELGERGAGALREMRHLLDQHRAECELIAVGIETASQFVDAAKAGVDGVGISADLLRSLLVHPLTDRGLDQVLHDWSRRLARSRVGV